MIVKLKDICTKIGSGATPHGGKNAYKEKGISLIRSQNVLDYSFSYDGLAFIDEFQANKLNGVTVEEDDVLINITGDSVARACVVENLSLPARVNQHVCIIRADRTKVLSSYILHYFQMMKSGLLLMASGGATRKALTKSMIENLEIDLPSLIEQRRIVSLLDHINCKIENNNQINRNLLEQAKTLFKSWFLEANNSDKWEKGTFSNLVVSTLGGDWGKENATGNYTEQVYCVRGADIPEVNAGNKGKLPTRYILPKNYNAKKLLAGDIVVEISGGSPTQSTGRVAAISQSLLNRYDKGMICTNFCRAIKPKSGYSMFIYYYWQYLYDKGVFFLYENGTTGIKNLDINGFLESEEIIIPPKELVERFDSFCQSVFDQVFKNGIANEKLANLRDSLLPKLMSGELDVSNIEI